MVSQIGAIGEGAVHHGEIAAGAKERSVLPALFGRLQSIQPQGSCLPARGQVGEQPQIGHGLLSRRHAIVTAGECASAGLFQVHVSLARFEGLAKFKPKPMPLFHSPNW